MLSFAIKGKLVYRKNKHTVFYSIQNILHGCWISFMCLLQEQNSAGVNDVWNDDEITQKNYDPLTVFVINYGLESN